MNRRHPAGIGYAPETDAPARKPGVQEMKLGDRVGNSVPEISGPRAGRLQPLSARVVDQIRNLIVDGSFAFGEQLSENGLATQLGVSRTPIREALQQLSREKLVNIVPQKGTFVLSLDVQEVRKMSEMRQVLEIGALQLGALRNSHGLLLSLARNLQMSRRVVREADERSYYVLDHSFHGAIIDCSQNEYLIEAYNSLSFRVQAVRYRTPMTREEMETAISDHELIFAKIEVNDIAGAADILKTHVFRGYHALVEMMRFRGDQSVGHAETKVASSL